MATPLVMWWTQWLVTLDCHASSPAPAAATTRPGMVWRTTNLELGSQERELMEKVIQETNMTERLVMVTLAGMRLCWR